MNAVAPGQVETGISGMLRGDQEEAVEDYRFAMALGGQGPVVDTGTAVHLLCGPESSWVTGAILPASTGLQHEPYDTGRWCVLRSVNSRR